MLKIMLVRHGETFWNLQGKLQGNSDIHLAPDGLHQARLLAAHCIFETADAVYSSNLTRAKTTALFLADRFGVNVSEVPELREINFGDWEGQFIRELAEKYPEDMEKFFKEPDNLQIKNAETFFEAQDRCFAAFQKIVAAHNTPHKNQHIIIVAHGAANRLILCKILDIPVRNMWKFAQFNTAVNVIRADEENFTVELINGTAHLYNR